MAKFHIHLRSRDKFDKDDVGVDVPSLAEAREVAIAILRELLAENIHAGSSTPVEAAIITDGSGRELMAIPVQHLLPEPLKRRNPTLRDIQRRAYEIWQSAGMPEGRDEEFYYLAERELTFAAEEPSKETK
jgi:hypothetical protein